MAKKFIKQKSEEQLGFRTPNFLRAKRFGSQKPGNFNKYNPGIFKTQHKG